MAATLHRLRSWLGAALAAATLSMACVSVAEAAPTPTTDGEFGVQIVGGTRASTSTYPWVVYLATSSGFQYCGGTLVAPNKVVTAAHCTEGDSASAVRVVAGLRSAGIGAALMAEAEARARAAGAVMIQLTTDRSRTRAR